MHGIGAVFIDLARRAGRRLRAGLQRAVAGLVPAAAGLGAAVGIKAAPGLPLEMVRRAGRSSSWPWAAGSRRRCWSAGAGLGPRRATILPASNYGATPAAPTGARRPAHRGASPPGHTLTAEPGPPVPVAAPGQFLLDPIPSVTRAGWSRTWPRIGAWKIDPMIAFLATDREVSTPFARTLRVLESMPWHEKQAARRLRELASGRGHPPPRLAGTWT